VFGIVTTGKADVWRMFLEISFKLQVDSCLRPKLLTLHTISKIAAPIKQAITRTNITRQGPEQSRWKVSTGAVYCNIHYMDFMGPNKKNKNLVPVHFKKHQSEYQFCRRRYAGYSHWKSK